MKDAPKNVFELISWAWLFKLVHGFGDAISPAGLPKVHLRYREGRGQLIYGTLPTWVVKGVEELLHEHGIQRAVIKLRRNGRLDLSRSIPDDLRQRLRNLILNQ